MTESLSMEQREAMFRNLTANEIPPSVVGKKRFVQYQNRILSPFKQYSKYRAFDFNQWINWSTFVETLLTHEEQAFVIPHYKRGAQMATKTFTETLDWCKSTQASLWVTFTTLQGWIDYEEQGKAALAKRNAESAAERNRARVAAHREKIKQLEIDLGIREKPSEIQLRKLFHEKNELEEEKKQIENQMDNMALRISAIGNRVNDIETELMILVEKQND